MRMHILFAIPFLAMIHLGCGAADLSELPEPGAVRVPLRLALDAEVLGAGESSTGTVNLREPALDEGAVVALSASDDASLAMPTTITIAPGDDTGTFVVTNRYGGESKLVTITAAYDSASVARALFVPCFPPEPPICTNHSCTR